MKVETKAALLTSLILLLGVAVGVLFLVFPDTMWNIFVCVVEVLVVCWFTYGLYTVILIGLRE